MSGTQPHLVLPVEALAALMPLHVLLDGAGRVEGCGPTFRRLFAVDPVGRMLEELVEPISGPLDDRPEAATGPVRVRLRLRHDQRILLRGTAVRLDDGRVLVDLGFGISSVQAVRRFALSADDFRASDVTLELLYLVEAKAAMMEALRARASRLEGERRAAEQRALRDALTGLGNRRRMEQALRELTTPHVRRPFALLALDLDGFKAVNDRFGHAVGDSLLRHVARVLRASTREEDIVTRPGGDEFIVLLVGCAEAAVVDRVAHRILARLARPLRRRGQSIRVTVSVGSRIVRPGERRGAAALLDEVDRALYAAKEAGRARHVRVDEGA